MPVEGNAEGGKWGSQGSGAKESEHRAIVKALKVSDTAAACRTSLLECQLSITER